MSFFTEEQYEQSGWTTLSDACDEYGITCTEQGGGIILVAEGSETPYLSDEQRLEQTLKDRKVIDAMGVKACLLAVAKQQGMVA